MLHNDFKMTFPVLACTQHWDLQFCSVTHPLTNTFNWRQSLPTHMEDKSPNYTPLISHSGEQHFFLKVFSIVTFIGQNVSRSWGGQRVCAMRLNHPFSLLLVKRWLFQLLSIKICSTSSGSGPRTERQCDAKASRASGVTHSAQGGVWKVLRRWFKKNCACRRESWECHGLESMFSNLSYRQKKSWLPLFRLTCRVLHVFTLSLYSPCQLLVLPQIQRHTSPPGWRRSSGGPSSLLHSARPHLAVTPRAGDRSNTTPGYVAPSASKTADGVKNNV